MSKLAPGDSAPQFSLPDQDGKPVALRDFAGRKALVYFYPKDDTPGCTKEACQFNDNLSALDRADIPVVGISADSAQSHVRFRNKYGLKFPLLTDAGHKVAAEYGAYGEKKLYGKLTVGVIRSTFLVDEQGKIEKAWYNVKADGHAGAILRDIGAI